MTITRVQGNAQNFMQSISQLIVTLANTPLKGNLLIAAIGNANVPGPPFIVSNIVQTGVTWTFLTQQTDFLNFIDVEIWAGVVNQNGASVTVTINLSGSPNELCISDICEYSGQAVNFLDQVAGNGNDGGTTQTDTGTTSPTTNSNELLVGAIFASNYQDAAQINPTNGFTLLDGIVESSLNSLAYLEKIVTAIGSANTGTTIGATNPWAGCIVTIIAAPPPPSIRAYGDGLTWIIQ